MINTQYIMSSTCKSQSNWEIIEIIYKHEQFMGKKIKRWKCSQRAIWCTYI